MKEKKIKLDKFNIAKNSKPLLIAEIGINHNGSLSLARKMLNKAVDCGADIVKFQTHLVEDEMLPSKNKKTGSHVKGSLFDILKKCSLTKKDHINLQRLCKKRKVMFLSTPFSKEAVDLLTSIKVSAFKIGSGETKNYHFIEYILKKNIFCLTNIYHSIKSILLRNSWILQGNGQQTFELCNQAGIMSYMR